VIGINTAIFSPSGGSVGIGFALPSSLAKSVFAQLRKSGHLDRGWLGVKIQQVTDEVAESVGLKKAHGALIIEVDKKGPSAKSGIVPGDIITSFDGKEVKEMRNLPRIVAETPIGKTVPVEIWHNGATKTVTIKTGEMKDSEEPENAADDGEGDVSGSADGKTILGMTLVPFSAEMHEKRKFPADLKGTIIGKIVPSSEAAKRGLQAGDLVVQVGEVRVISPKDAVEAIAAVRKSGRKYVLIRILRNAQVAMFVTVPVEEKK